MEYGAIDLHQKESQVRIVTETGEVLGRRIPTTRGRFTAMFWGRPRLRILLEASAESEWVAQHLETLGHDVVVADPNYTPMYGQRSRRVKTDQRDVAALTYACQRGIYHVVHRRSAPQRTVQAQLHIRRTLTDSRTRAISLARAITRGAGFRVRSGSTASFLTRVAALDDVRRFGGAGQVTSYLGLVPQEYSSGERLRRGRVLHSAQPHLQSLLVQAAWRLSRSSSPDTAALRAWAQGITRRRGQHIAMVALARRLARILFAMWRDGAPFDAARIRPTRAHGTAPIVEDATRPAVNE